MLVENDSDTVSSLQPLPPSSVQVPVTVTSLFVHEVVVDVTVHVGAVTSTLTVFVPHATEFPALS